MASIEEIGGDLEAIVTHAHRATVMIEAGGGVRGDIHTMLGTMATGVEALLGQATSVQERCIQARGALDDVSAEYAHVDMHAGRVLDGSETYEGIAEAYMHYEGASGVDSALELSIATYTGIEQSQIPEIIKTTLHLQKLLSNTQAANREAQQQAAEAVKLTQKGNKLVRGYAQSIGYNMAGTPQ